MALKGKHGAMLAGRYRLLEQLGEGGMGSVWKAEHLLLHSHVAIKIVDPDAARLEFNLARFLREAKTLASLRSPNVVQVLDFGSDAETPYLVMELLQGQTLGRRLADQGRLSLGETSRILHDVCLAMSLVHEQGLIHRDLKPENIFLCNAGDQQVTKVVDFGIAKSLRGDMTASMKTRTGHMLGTPSYMSPEQCRGLKDIDHRADLWALGVIAYECLVGKVPFEGEVLGDLLLRICMDPLPIPSQQARCALPGAFDAWFAKAVARDRSARFQSSLELATTLAELSATVGLGNTVLSSREALSSRGALSSREAPEPSRPSLPRISAVALPAASPRQPSNTETNTTVGLVGSVRRADRRARLAAAVGVGVAAAVGLWAIGNERSADSATSVEVQSLRPPYEVVPKVIRPGVPSGRRWQPSAASTGARPFPGQPEKSDAFVPGAPHGVGRPLAAPPLGGGALPDATSGHLATSNVATSILPQPAAGPRVATVDSLGVVQAGAGVPSGVAVQSGAALPSGAAVSSGAPSGAGVSPGAPSGTSASPSPAGPAPSAPAGSAAGSPNAGAASPPKQQPPSPPAAPPGHGRQLHPSPPSAPPAPLRGTAAPAAPSRARQEQPGDENIRRAR